MVVETRTGESNKAEFEIEDAVVSLDIIHTLPQIRKSYEGIAELGQNISRFGLLHRLSVAALDESHVCQYLRMVKNLWGVEINRSDVSYKDTYRGYTLFLIAGHRRLMAMQYLSVHSPDFDPNQIEVRLYKNIDPVLAMEMQAAENLHQQVPPSQEAEGISRLFKLRRSQNPNFSISAFAKELGKSWDSVSSALNFVLLPEEVQDLVASKSLAYGKAVELQRLYSEVDDMPTDERRVWLDRATLKRETGESFRAAARARAQQKDQVVMALFSQDELVRQLKLYRRRIVAPELAAPINVGVHYLEAVKRVLDEGEMKSIYSEGSPTNTSIRLARFLVSIMKGLELYNSHSRANQLNQLELELGQIMEQLNLTDVTEESES